MAEDNEVYVGQHFDSEESAKTFLSEYNKNNFYDFVIATNNKRSLILICKHGRKRLSESRGIRKNLHYIFVDCGAKVNMYNRACCQMKKFKNNYGHSKVYCVYIY